MTFRIITNDFYFKVQYRGGFWSGFSWYDFEEDTERGTVSKTFDTQSDAEAFVRQKRRDMNAERWDTVKTITHDD